MRRLIDLASMVKRLDGFVWLNTSARSDIGGGYLRSNGTERPCCTITGGQILRFMCFPTRQAHGAAGHIRAKNGSSFNGPLACQNAISLSKR